MERIKGISVCNPVDVDKEYLLFTVDYAIQNKFNHLQIIGPIHDGIKGNIDGMTLYRKYSCFNYEKCLPYVEQTMEAIHAACKLTVEHGIKTYVWHHELELPTEFKEVYPEVVNSCGDIEVTHPLVKDFLEHKIRDFFYAYPDINGVILTLHETKVPLLKLKEQKLGKIDRVKYVTQILYDVCTELGKELIVRPFASIEEDYIMMAKAYEEISADLLIMDKWTQFDWSLTLPNNQFYRKIKNNPLLVEADIFGEYFGKGRLPLMLKDHIAEKFAYCDGFEPSGYVARIDRAGEIPFGDVNEVNIVIAHAHLNQKNVEQEIDTFFQKKYGEAWQKVRNLMEQTEDILRKTIYAKGYYFTELSFFPTLNHCKNHYYFEIMRQNSNLVSNEWYIPPKWKGATAKEFLEEKENAVYAASQLYERLLQLKPELSNEEYEKLWVKFANLKYVTNIWKLLTKTFIDYVLYFDTCDAAYQSALEQDLEQLLELNRQGKHELGNKFYCGNAVEMVATGADVEEFVKEIRESFYIEKKTIEYIKEHESGVLDYVVCGGAMESHGLQKEVNFSDVLVRDGALCRIAGNYRGAQWSTINAHGWFSYEILVKPNAQNVILVSMEGAGEDMDVRVCVGAEEYVISEKKVGRKEYSFRYTEREGKSCARIRFEKISGNTPCVFTIKVRGDA